MILTLFFLTIYFWKFSTEQGRKSSIDLLKIRQGAPQREVKRQVIKEFHNPELQKIKTNKKKKDEFEEVTSDSSRDEQLEYQRENEFEDSYNDEENSDDFSRKMAGTQSEDLATDDSIVENNIEENLNAEMSEFLQNLDPEYGEEIFENYSREKEAYRNQLEELSRNDDGKMDMETIIGQLEQQHEEKMRDILGPYYQVVKEQYSNFLENIPQ